jgi:phage/plasmid-associated DNA primase
MAKSEPGMTVQLIDFDDDPLLLGVANGTLNLRTGKLMPVCTPPS